MNKIKDRLILGTISGILGSQPAKLLNTLEHKMGLIDAPYSQVASRLFNTKDKVTKAVVLSALINNINVSVAGVVITYVLSMTGRDKAILKGTGVGCVLWDLNNVVSKIKTKQPLTPLLSFIDFVTFGALTGLLVSKLGDNSLFPDKIIKQQDEILVVYNGGSQSNELGKKRVSGKRLSRRSKA